MKRSFLTIGVLIVLLIGTIFGFFLSQKSSKSQEETTATQTLEAKSDTLTIISTGDIGLVRDINYQIQQKQDPKYPFLKIADYLKNADLTITSLEGPLIKNCPITLTGFKFCGEDSNVKGLVYAGVDAASLANNHSTNFDLDGLNQTSAVLKSASITSFGQNNNIEYLNITSKKVALVGFVELGNNWTGLNNATPVSVAKLVSEAKIKADIVICTFHWGIEYTRKPTQNQTSLAHLAIDSGADIVLGNHPHWIQDNEIYKGKFITYAQGNTIFDQDWSQETKEGVIYKFEYKDGKFNKIDEKYTIIEQNVQPRFASEKETAIIKQKIADSLE